MHALHAVVLLSERNKQEAAVYLLCHSDHGLCFAVYVFAFLVYFFSYFSYYSGELESIFFWKKLSHNLTLKARQMKRRA